MQYIKSLPERDYDSKEKCWTLPWKVYNDVKQGLKNIKSSSFDIEEMLPSVLEVHTFIYK